MAEDEYEPSKNATSLNELLEDGRRFIQWAKEIGAQVGPGNWVEAVTRDADQVLKERPERQQELLGKRFGSLEQSEEAISDLIHLRHIRKNIGEQDQITLKAKVSTALKGTASLSKESSGDTRSRDVRFELSVCARLNDRGMRAKLTDPNPDIAVTWKKASIAIECKRVANVKRLNERLRHASSQLQAKNSSSVDSRLVFCDVTRIIAGLVKRGGPIEEAIDAANGELLKIGRPLRSYLKRELIENIDAVVLYYQHYAVPSSSTYTLVGHAQSLVVENPLPDRKRNRLLKRIERKLDPTSKIYEDSSNQ